MDQDTLFAVNGLALSIGILVYDLDQKTDFDGHAYLKSLIQSAEALEASPGPRLNELSAADLRRVAQIVELGPNQPVPPWQPVVIDGGKPDPDGI